MKRESQAIVVLGGALTAHEQLSNNGRSRTDTAIAEWRNGVVPNLVMSGGHSFMSRAIPSVSEADAMRRYATALGVPGEVIYTEEDSLDTIGNAYFTKTQIVVPNDWDRIAVVASGSQMARALRAFRHVYGKDFEVIGLPAPERPTPRGAIYEIAGSIMLNEVLRGTEPGDDDAILNRLREMVPGYGDSTIIDLATKSLAGLLRNR